MTPNYSYPNECIRRILHVLQVKGEAMQGMGDNADGISVAMAEIRNLAFTEFRMVPAEIRDDS